MRYNTRTHRNLQHKTTPKNKPERQLEPCGRSLVFCRTGANTAMSTPTNLHRAKTAAQGKLSDGSAT